MMLLNTTFGIDAGLTRHIFLDLVKHWLDDSPFYTISLDDYNESDDEYTIVSEDENQKIFIGNYDSVFILQVSCFDSEENVTYLTNYVLDDISDKKQLHVSQERINESISLSIQSTPIKLPNLLKSIFWNEYGGMDNDIPVDNKAVILRKNDIELASKIVTHDIKFDNPIVYISPNIKSGLYDVNYDFLAQALIGQAHVFVEGSPRVSSDVKELTHGANPYDGDVTIYLPGTECTTLSQHGKGFNNEVIDTVRKALLTVGVPDKFNVNRLKQMHALSKFDDNGELTKLCEDMLTEKDNEIKQLNDELSILKTQLASVNAKADSLQDGFDKTIESGGNTIDLIFTETDLYAGERKDVILKILQKEYDAMKDDSNLSRSRKFDVISDVLEHNFPRTTDAELIECLEEAIKDGALTREGIGRLQAVGYVIEKSGRSAHYKVTFNGDQRYTAVFPSTPSDKARGTKNFISDFANKLFGY